MDFGVVSDRSGVSSVELSPLKRPPADLVKVNRVCRIQDGVERQYLYPRSSPVRYFILRDGFHFKATSTFEMSGPSDKAQFFLEQAVPQLQEFKEKKIFSEVSSPKTKLGQS